MTFAPDIQRNRVKSRRSKTSSPNHIVVRACHGIEEFKRCLGIEREVWKSSDVDVVPIPIFVVAAETGGHVIGAFAGRKMVGFSLAIAGWRERRPFLHSHMTAVVPEYQNRGIGYRLKLFQREDALARGIGLIEWTFDPLMTRNAYLNLVRLGAVAGRYLPDAYGITTSPLHGGLPTDRLVAEWRLQAPRVRRIVKGSRATVAFSKHAIRITIPSEIDALTVTNPQAVIKLQKCLRADFQRWFAKGYAATAVAPTTAGIDYILEPRKAL